MKSYSDWYDIANDTVREAEGSMENLLPSAHLKYLSDLLNENNGTPAPMSRLPFGVRLQRSIVKTALNNDICR